ncbi:MAG: pantetheine-phosphate adenylyltransferase [Lachnospiraceae bacterium]|nr:pantetheine-phosphate adenylyltransferase [Lachnospiraceae bacterium]MBR6999685.1 pantetheine-phosphate adenylyltransferase [Lachnospiraceae bacterium]
MKVGIYAGSFDPVTLGHLDVIERASRIVDRLVIGVLNNTNKKPSFTAEERVEFIQRVTKDIPNVEVKTFDGLTVDFAKQEKARILVRGLRAVTDFEYELQIAQLNHKLDPKIDTIFLTTSVEYSYLSSSIVKEIAHFGGDISKLVPKEVCQDIVDKLAVK